MTNETKELCQQLIQKVGEDTFAAQISQLLSDESKTTLTIISNAGVHPLAAAHTRGEVFFASEGNLDFSSSTAVHEQFKASLVKVAAKLKARRWTRVYLVPFGPAVLTAQIKLLVYEVLHITTIDVLHIGENKYVDVQVASRDIAMTVDG